MRFRPYGEKDPARCSNLSHALTEYKHPSSRSVRKKPSVDPVTSGQRLCGGLNTNVLRLVLAR